MKYDNLSDYLDALEQRIDLISAGNEILRLDLQKDMALEPFTERSCLKKADTTKRSLRSG